MAEINWHQDIEKAIRIDKRTDQELIACIDWIYSGDGDFWRPNILSGKKLREKFDTMEAQMISSTKNKKTMVDRIYEQGLTPIEAVKLMEEKVRMGGGA